MVNFNYHFVPIHEHFDGGFGATAEAFREAGKKLSGDDPGLHFAYKRLPINYLYRHSVELYLKSAILIIHRRLQLPFGEIQWSVGAHVFANGGWKPFTQVHSVSVLWSRVKALLVEQRTFFESVTTVDWTFPQDFDVWIDKIERSDPRSTFYRYPSTTDPSADASKAHTARGSAKELREVVASGKKTGPMLVFVDDEDNVLGGYYEKGDGLDDESSALRETSDFLDGTHAALRSEVCGGR